MLKILSPKKEKLTSVLKKELLGVLNGLKEKLVISVWRVCSRSARVFGPCKSGLTDGSTSLQRPIAKTIGKRWGNCSGRCISSEKDRQKQKMQSASAGKISVAELEQEREKLVSSVVVWADEGKAFKVEVWAGKAKISRPEALADEGKAFKVEVWVGKAKISRPEAWAGQTQICRPEVWADGNSVPMVDEEVIGTPAFHAEVCVTGGRTAIAQSGTGSNTTFEKPSEKIS